MTVLDMVNAMMTIASATLDTRDGTVRRVSFLLDSQSMYKCLVEGFKANIVCLCAVCKQASLCVHLQIQSLPQSWYNSNPARVLQVLMLRIAVCFLYSLVGPENQCCWHWSYFTLYPFQKGVQHLSAGFVLLLGCICTYDETIDKRTG